VSGSSEDPWDWSREVGDPRNMVDLCVLEW